MKKYFLFSFLFVLTTCAIAQNVGIGTATPSDQLHTTGIVRFENYSGVGDRVLTVDSNGKLKASGGHATFHSNNNGVQSIPDNGCSTGLVAHLPITVSGVTNFNPAKIAVKLNITHGYTQDLAIYLYNPAGNPICLSRANGGAGNNYTNTIFTDGGSSITSSANLPPYTGIYAPQGIALNCSNGFFVPQITISNFGGFSPTSVNGTWHLNVYDLATGDVGTLDNWEIGFDGAESFSPPQLSVNLTAPNSSSKTGQVLTATDSLGHSAWNYAAPYNTGFKATLQSNILASTGVVTTIPFYVDPAASASQNFDDGSNFDNMSYGYSAPADGVYQFNTIIIGSSITTTTQVATYIVRLKSNGSIISSNTLLLSNGDLVPNVTFSAVEKLQEGDVITVELYNNTGTGLPIGNKSLFSGVRLY